MWGTKGFTQLELLFVIAVLGILAVCARPQVEKWHKDAHLRKAVREFIGALRHTRSLAIAANLEHRLEVDLAGRRLRLTHGNRPANSSASSWNNNIVFDWLPLPVGGLRANADCSVSSEIVKFHFNPVGTANPRYLCVLDDAGSRRFQIGVPYSTTGKVVVRRWNPNGNQWE